MKKLRNILTGIILAILFGCSNDNDWNNENGTIDLGDEVMLTLELNVPTTSTPISYALTEADENKLDKLDILVFKDNGEGNAETYLYLMHATDINNNNGNVNKTFKVRVEKSARDVKHRIVLLANARNELDAVKESFNTSMTKAEVLSMIQFNSNIKWNTTSSTDFVPLPMWGEATDTHPITSETTGALIGPIKLLRSVARIDVGLNIDDNAVALGLGERFMMKEVKVYNANAKSLVAPDPSKINNNKALFPSLLVDEEREVVTPAIRYTHETADYGFIREIYVGEARNKPEVGQPQLNDENVFCIVVGGYYTKDGEQPNTTRLTWYRVDFYERDSEDDPQNTRFDILRNHRYKINITDVKGPGYETPEIAFNSKPLNMRTTIEAWDEADMNDQMWDGQYQLTVNRSRFTLYKEGGGDNPQILKIYTDHPDGWNIEIPNSGQEDYRWIHVSNDNDHSLTPVEVGITADAYPGQTASRTGYFYICAGRMRKKIHVTQLNETELSIEVTPDELTFRKSAAQPKSITVTTYPSNATVYISKIDGENGINWTLPNGSDGFPASGFANAGSYSFQPAPNGSDYLRSTVVTVTAQIPGDVRKVSKTVIIYQDKTDFIFEPFDYTTHYFAQKGTYKFKVNSDRPWKIKEVSEPTYFAEAPDLQAKPAGQNLEYSFVLHGNKSWAKREITFTPAPASENDLDFSGRPFTITQSFVPPWLTISQNGNDITQIDFGGAQIPDDKKVIITTNSKWKYSLADRWGNVIKNPTGVLPNDEHGEHKYFERSLPITVTFTPSYTTAEGTPAGGTSNVEKFYFETINHNGVTADRKELTIKRAVPIYFTNPSVSLDPATIPIAGSGAKAKLKAKTNGKITLKAWEDKADPNPDVFLAEKWSENRTAYGDETVEVVIPMNKSWSERKVILTSNNEEWDATNNTFITTRGVSRATYMQAPGFYITSASSDLETKTIAAAGGTIITTTLKGNFTNITKAVRAVKVLPNNGGYAMLKEGNITESASSSSIGLEIPKNDSWSSREVKMQYRNPKDGEVIYYDIGSAKSQEGYKIESTSATPVTGADGGASTIKITGYQSGVRVRIWDITNDRVLEGTSAVDMPSTTATNTVSSSIRVPANTGAKRILKAEYSTNGQNNWAKIGDTWTQAEAPYFKNVSSLGTYLISKAWIPDDTYKVEQVANSGQTDSACTLMMGSTDWYVPSTSDEAKMVDAAGVKNSGHIWISTDGMATSQVQYNGEVWQRGWYQRLNVKYNSWLLGASMNEPGVEWGRIQHRCIKKIN